MISEHQKPHSDLLSVLLIQAKKQSIGEEWKIGDDLDFAEGSNGKRNIPKGRTGLTWISVTVMKVSVRIFISQERRQIQVCD